MVPLHAAPEDAVAEIDALYDVYLDVQKKWGLQVSLAGAGTRPHLRPEQQVGVS